MSALRNFLFIASLATTSLASPVDSPLTLFHQIESIPKQWLSHGKAGKDTMIKAQIGLKQSNIEGLQAKLLDVSNPESSNYGKWLSKEEVAKYTAPPKGNAEAIKSWLNAHGIKDIEQPTNDWIGFTVPVSTMEKLLGTEYEWFVPKDGRVGQGIPRTKSYSVPKELHDMIGMITPTTAFYNPTKPMAEKATKADSKVSKRACDGTNITPDCLKQVYNVDYSASGNSLVAATLLIGLAASHSDFATFGRDYVSGLQDFRDVSISNGNNPGSGSNDDLTEGNLDTQYIGGLASPNPSQLLAVGPETNQGFADEIANLASYLTSTNNPPTAVSTSYDGEEQGFDVNYMDRVCNEFMKAGAQGISVFFSSGDYGVGGLNESNCNEGFYALWPPVCPWVTAVGGTQFTNGEEVVADYSPTLTSSGGGYSWKFDAPDYNKNDTTAYANSLDSSYNGYFNPSGRGYPDISLASLNYKTILNGGTYNVRGTSAATPAWAALVSILNDYRNSQGKAKLGFINPLLYSTGRSALRDVTSGNNYGCGTNGFYAGEGWDPATGLGSVDFAKLRALI